MDTRMKLLLAAERLFALRGPDGTSARMIVAAAGQKNASALNYYFATREELIEAICRLRMEPINDDRIERVAQYLAHRPPPADRLHALVGILCLPSLIPIIDARGKSYFRRFLAQAINSPSTNFVPIVRDRFDSGLRQAAPLMREEMPQLPINVADKRIATLIRVTSYLSAHLEARCAEGPWTDRKIEMETEIQLQIDGFVGFLRGAHSATVAAKSLKTKSSDKRALKQTWEGTLS
jgi:AcrR family transcriptional regulator